MKKKEKIDFIVGLSLLILAGVILLLPTFKITNIRVVLLTIFSFYTIIMLINFILTYEEKDYESILTSLVSLLGVIATLCLELRLKNMVMILMIWMGLMSLVKLKKADFYHDRKSKMWILRLLMLFIFIASGLLLGINLFYENNIQILIIGNFFLINGILDIIDPIVSYIERGKNEDSK